MEVDQTVTPLKHLGTANLTHTTYNLNHNSPFPTSSPVSLFHHHPNTSRVAQTSHNTHNASKTTTSFLQSVNHLSHSTHRTLRNKSIRYPILFYKQNPYEQTTLKRPIPSQDMERRPYQEQWLNWGITKPRRARQSHRSHPQKRIQSADRKLLEFHQGEYFTKRESEGQDTKTTATTTTTTD